MFVNEYTWLHGRVVKSKKDRSLLCILISFLICLILKYYMYANSFSTPIGALQAIKRERASPEAYSRQRTGFTRMVMMKLKMLIALDWRILRWWLSLLKIQKLTPFLLFFLFLDFLLVLCSWWILLRIDIKMKRQGHRLQGICWTVLWNIGCLWAHSHLTTESKYDSGFVGHNHDNCGVSLVYTFLLFSLFMYADP